MTHYNTGAVMFNELLDKSLTRNISNETLLDELIKTSVTLSPYKTECINKYVHQLLQKMSAKLFWRCLDRHHNSAMNTVFVVVVVEWLYCFFLFVFSLWWC